MGKGTIRVGFVGAGGNTRAKHIPGFQAQDGVEVVSVCNRSHESSERVAKEFGIPTVYDNWRELVEADDTDAICIGTWPYMHYPVTLAALEAGKHVLCEARMAMDAAEAQEMLAASRAEPHLITQVVPAPQTLHVDCTIQDLIADGYCGNLLAVELRSGNGFVDCDGPMTWRQDVGLSGFNTLWVGLWYEVLIRWVGEATKVAAMAKVFVKDRKDESGVRRAVQVPDHVDILADMACGAQAHLVFSAVRGLAGEEEVWLYGSEGTLQLRGPEYTLHGGRRGDSTLDEIPISPEKSMSWRVEEEFVGAIRGEEMVVHTSFEDGVKYMDFTEAVVRAAQTGETIPLPL